MIMEDPVITMDGHSFERAAIEQWFQHNDTNPLTGTRLASKTLLSNRSLRDAISESYDKERCIVPFSEIQLGRRIGQGRHKVVFIGKWSGRDVAVMKIHEDICGAQPDILRKLGNQPHLVRLLCQSSNDKFVYLCTELASRGSLRDVINEYADDDVVIPASALLEIALQVCTGMQNLCAQGFIHRDLAMRNVLVFSFHPKQPLKTIVKVSDFGLSREGSVYYGGGSLPIR